MSKFEGTVTDDYILQPGDTVCFRRTTFYHKHCRAIKLNNQVEKEIREALESSGWNSYWLKAVKNEYGSSLYNGPWFKILTPYGTLHIGWRKRVIKLGFSHPVIDFRSILNEGVNCGVTVAEDLVHCWGYDALKQNLSEVLQRVINTTPHNRQKVLLANDVSDPRL